MLTYADVWHVWQVDVVVVDTTDWSLGGAWLHKNKKKKCRCHDIFIHTIERSLGGAWSIIN